MRSGGLFLNGNVDTLLGAILILFAVSWSISDSIILSAYTLFLLALIPRIVFTDLPSLKIKDPVLQLPILLSLWRLLTSYIAENISLKVLWKASKFLFDISPVLVFRALPDASRPILLIFPVAVGLMTLMAIGVRYLGLPLDFYSGGQLKAFFVNHIKSGFIWSLASLTALILGIKHDRRFLFLMPLLIYGLMITHARSYYLGFLCSALMVVLLLSLKRSPRYTLIGGGLLLSILGVGYSLPSVRDRFLSIFTQIDKDMSIKCRLYMWRESLEAVKSDPIFGIGFQKWPEFFQGKGYPCPNYHAHNIYLHEFVETGILGGLILILFLGYLIFKLTRTYLSMKGDTYEEAVVLTGLSALVNFGIGGFFEPALVKTAVLIPTFTLVGLALGVSEVRSNL